MIIFDGKEYRNLQEQVLKNKDDIANLKRGTNLAELGIKIVNAEDPLANAGLLPDAATYTGDYGDGYLVGSTTPFDLYVYSRSSDPTVKGYWFPWGPVNAPSIIPGPIGPQGIDGPQGIRGSFWYTQSGAPTATVGVNPYDQALDGSTGDVYQFVNGAWQPVGNIRGPQGIQGIQGIMGPPGPQGQTGPQGPRGEQGQFIQILGTLANTNQLPMIDTAPRYAAYLIPDSTGAEHVWLIIGEGTPANPYVWHDAGAFAGGTKVTIGGTQQDEVEVENVINGAASYDIGENTGVTVNEGNVAFTNLEASGSNLAGQEVKAAAAITLPIVSSSEIELTSNNNALEMNLTSETWNEIGNMVEEAKPQEVQITAPTTSTSGQLSENDLETLQSNKGAYLMFNDEIYRLQDNESEPGYLVYSHIGYNPNTQVYMIKCINVTTSTREWELTTREVADPSNYYTKSDWDGQTTRPFRYDLLITIIANRTTGTTCTGRLLVNITRIPPNQATSPTTTAAFANLLYNNGGSVIVSGKLYVNGIQYTPIAIIATSANSFSVVAMKTEDEDVSAPTITIPSSSGFPNGTTTYQTNLVTIHYL